MADRGGAELPILGQPSTAEHPHRAHGGDVLELPLPEGDFELPDHVEVRPDTRHLWAALKTVRDPELPVSLVDLGLIYDIRRDGDAIEVDCTFTATACPCMSFIEQDIQDRLLEESDVRRVRVNVVWSPAWTRKMMTQEGRALLRKYGVAA